MSCSQGKLCLLGELHLLVVYTFPRRVQSGLKVKALECGRSISFIPWEVLIRLSPTTPFPFCLNPVEKPGPATATSKLRQEQRPHAGEVRLMPSWKRPGPQPLPGRTASGGTQLEKQVSRDPQAGQHGLPTPSPALAGLHFPSPLESGDAWSGCGQRCMAAVHHCCLQGPPHSRTAKQRVH